MSIPTDGTDELAEIAEYAFKHYALFVWLVTHPQPQYLDGPNDFEITNMISEATKLVSKIEDDGPSSIFLALRGGYTKDPLGAMATERLVLLALLAERPQLVSKVLRTFPETSDPIRLMAILRPYTDSHIENYAETYANNMPRDPGILQSLAAISRLRLMHNLMLEDAIKARYAMVTIMADPYTFGTSSLGEIKSLMAKIEATTLANPTLYQPLSGVIATLKSNYSKVEGTVHVGAAVTQDALRRLRLLLGVLNTTDTLMDKMAMTASAQ